MAKRALKSEDIEGFVRAFNDETVDTEKLYQLRIEWHLCKGRYGSQLYFRGYAFEMLPDGSEAIYAQTEYEWPTHRANSLHAALYGASMRLNAAVQTVYRERTGHWYSSPVEEPAR